ncbi:hypothetical protein U1Q18_021743 [Sarracenia purpurea var. burkii]
METPEFFHGTYFNNTQFTPECRISDPKSAGGDHFIVEDLLEFPNDDAGVENGKFGDTVAGGSSESSAITIVESCNSSFSGSGPQLPGDVGCRSFADDQFSSDICVPIIKLKEKQKKDAVFEPHASESSMQVKLNLHELAELEWLSNFVEESFSSEDLQKLQLISGMAARADESSETREFHPETTRNSPVLCPEITVPGKARSKRSRAAPCNWTSRLLALSPTPTAKAALKKKESGDNAVAVHVGGDGRRCLHCATDKTPQWRTGPMGPKTLCNACGVRYKSGRLVPEYRPAASPTFVLTKHSNSHRKVMELRRQKELQRVHTQPPQYLDPTMGFDFPDGDDYLIHQHIGPDFRQLI